MPQGPWVEVSSSCQFNAGLRLSRWPSISMRAPTAGILGTHHRCHPIPVRTAILGHGARTSADRLPQAPGVHAGLRLQVLKRNSAEPTPCDEAHEIGRLTQGRFGRVLIECNLHSHHAHGYPRKLPAH